MGSRKKHRNKETNFYNEGQMMNNNPFGMDFNNLNSLFGNIDQNQLMSMIQMLGQNGINMDNMNSMLNNNQYNNMNVPNNNFNNKMNDFENKGNTNIREERGNDKLDADVLINKLMGNSTGDFKAERESIYKKINEKENVKHSNIEEIEDDDPNIEMLLAMRKIVNKERVRFIDKIIQLYLSGNFGEF
ncbi:MAG: hypothetical protein ACRDDY_19055 [Clostridium sp.]|uniref:hypothetical protein n=1 Tax=Clostridium sp. TaxID=1506 RepID=UPI003EE7D7CB